jgi:hypothetical protein
MEHQRIDFEAPDLEDDGLYHSISTDGPKAQTRALVEELLQSEGMLEPSS